VHDRDTVAAGVGADRIRPGVLVAGRGGDVPGLQRVDAVEGA
jgi:hypothetical protein